MADRVWIKFAPAVVTTADLHHLLRYARELADGGKDEHHRARLSVVDGIRRDLIHARSRSAVSVVVRAAI